MLVARGLKHIWYPCSQMKDYETFKPIIVSKAYGSYIETDQGKKIIDAISSWWCKSLGHNHPRLKHALLKQVEQFEHVIQANTVNETIVTLSEKLADLTDTLQKVFYASDGSTAVEIALKMSLQAQKIQGNMAKTKFMALKNGYHGESAGALSVSDIAHYKNAYNEILFPAHLIPTIPYVSSITDPLWQDCEEHWSAIEHQLNIYAAETCALILEPIVQGAGGMLIYSQDFLKRLRHWTQKHNIYLIADEIMTGIGRTGKMFACQHANIEPDFLCLGKGITSGWLPLSAVLTRDDIYRLFYDDYETGKSFLHSNGHCGNALAASLAIETLNIIREENLVERAAELGEMMSKMMAGIARKSGRLTNIRSIGAIVAADIIDNDVKARLGFAVYQKAVNLGALLRPLGNTIYWLPPLNIEYSTLEELQTITEQALL